MFFLHGCAMRCGDDNDFFARVCSVCESRLAARAVPEYSLAAGFDFGTLGAVRPALPALTVLERMSIALSLPMYTLTKLNTTGSSLLPYLFPLPFVLLAAICVLPPR